MLQYHSKKLLQIRLNCQSKFELLVQTYVYLREANHKDYQSLALMANLHQRMDELGMHQYDGDHGDATTKTANGNNKLPQCSLCKSPDLHILFSVENNRNVCPLGSLLPKAAKECRVEILSRAKLLGSDPSPHQLKVVLDTAIQASK
jgi:hypothetical protein